MGTATEQSLRNILTELQTDTLPTDAATQTTLALVLAELILLLTELQLKADLTETQPVSLATAPTTTVLSQGGDKIFAFESIVEEALANTSLAAGTNTLDGTAVPTGKVWKITQACLDYIGTVPTEIRIRAQGLATTLELVHQKSPVSDQYYFWSGEIYLQAGDYMQGRVTGATLNDDMIFRYAGVQMDAPG